jgi:hypothetical protein
VNKAVKAKRVETGDSAAVVARSASLPALAAYSYKLRYNSSGKKLSKRIKVGRNRTCRKSKATARRAKRAF